MARSSSGRWGVMGLAAGIAFVASACAVEPEPGSEPREEVEVGTSSSAATKASFATDDATAICNLAQTCCGASGYTINQTRCRSVMTSVGGLQGELAGYPYFTGANVTYSNTRANTCLAGSPRWAVATSPRRATGPPTRPVWA